MNAGARRNDYLLLALISTAASLGAFFYFFKTSQILLYGDAVAHINIARRVFDSRTPGWQQLGTVWLPLPHLLTMPFIVADSAWRSGWGGSVVSMVSFVAGALGIARLFWNGSFGASMRAAGWAAALFYIANPNLLYMQSTAMTESLSIALYIWALAFCLEFILHLRGATDEGTLSFERGPLARKAARSLELCALVLAAGMLTRYDHWIFAAAITCFAFVTIVSTTKASSEIAPLLRRAFSKYLLLCALIPALWLGYNFGTYGNALEFASGPYSAHAIAQRSSAMPSYPGERAPATAAIYYFKAAQLNTSEGPWRWTILLACFLGSAWLIFRRHFPLLVLLWLPLGFYALAVSYMDVPIFMPQWWPFSYYNVRYGLELLPAFAVFVGFTIVFLLRAPRRCGYALAGIFALLLAVNDVEMARGVPICLREARINSVTRIAFENQLASKLRELPAGATILMYTGDHVGALQQAGVHLARTLNENNYPFWQDALAHPAWSAVYVIAQQNDPVWNAVVSDPDGLIEIGSTEVSGQPRAVIYRSESSGKK